jgi:fatty acid desaturase
MTEQSRTELADRRDAAHPSAEHGGHGHNTTPMAWVLVVLMFGAFVLGGIALIYWNWPMFWAAVGAVVVLGVVGWAIGIMEMVTEYGGGGRGGDPGEFGYSPRSEGS